MKRLRATRPSDEILIVKEGRAVLRQLAKWLAEGGYSIETTTVSPAPGRQEPARSARVATVTSRAAGGARNGMTRAGKNMHAAALGRLGGRKGGFARAANLTARRRSEIARKAARARWRVRKAS